jgi:hypothetical protein
MLQGSGVIQDITEPSERGGYVSFYQASVFPSPLRKGCADVLAVRNFSIAIGPVLGGVLADFFGFR